MIIPFKPLELFELNPDYRIVELKENFVVIDNWYKNFNKITEILDNIPVPIWKTSINSRNFIDYFDCRPSISLPFIDPHDFTFFVELKKLVSRFFSSKPLQLINPLFEFNYFKNNIPGISSNYQLFPHTDKQEENFDVYNCIVYMDTISSGGTAFYPGIQELENKEHENILFDISQLNRFVIKSSPNRLVIFRGDMYHGGYIKNHDEYLNSWRKNHIIFLKETPYSSY